MPADEIHPHLRHLFAQYEMLGMIWLGKLPDPATGQTHRELPQVRAVIQFFEMLEAKTRGNLTPAEEGELRRVLTLLRLNYVEEARRPEPAAAEPEPEAAAAEPTPEASPAGRAAEAAPGARAEQPANESTAEQDESGREPRSGGLA